MKTARNFEKYAVGKYKHRKTVYIIVFESRGNRKRDKLKVHNSGTNARNNINYASN